MFQDYQSIKNLGELNNDLDFQSWYKKEQAKTDMANTERIRKSQGEGLGMALNAINRGVQGFVTGGPAGAAAGVVAGVAESVGNKNATTTASAAPTTTTTPATNYADLLKMYQSMNSGGGQSSMGGGQVSTGGGQVSTGGGYTNYSY